MGMIIVLKIWAEPNVARFPEQVLWSLFHMEEVVQQQQMEHSRASWYNAHFEKRRQGSTLLSELTQLMLSLLSGKLQ